MIARIRPSTSNEAPGRRELLAETARRRVGVKAVVEELAAAGANRAAIVAAVVNRLGLSEPTAQNDIRLMERAGEIPRLARVPKKAGPRAPWQRIARPARRPARAIPVPKPPRKASGEADANSGRPGAPGETSRPKAAIHPSARPVAGLPEGVAPGYGRRAAREWRRWTEEDQAVYSHWRSRVPEGAAWALFLCPTSPLLVGAVGGDDAGEDGLP